MGSSPALDQIFCVDFFRLCETFFRNFFNVFEGSTLHFFPYFAKEWMLKNSQRAPFTFFGTMRLTRNFKKIQKIFGNFFWVL